MGVYQVDEVLSTPINRIVYDDFGPQVGAVFDKIEVLRVGLVHGFVGCRIEKQEPRKSVRPLDHRAVGIGGHADMPLADALDVGEGLEARPQLCAVGISGFGGHPEKNVVYKHDKVRSCIGQRGTKEK